MMSFEIIPFYSTSSSINISSAVLFSFFQNSTARMEGVGDRIAALENENQNLTKGLFSKTYLVSNIFIFVCLFVCMWVLRQYPCSLLFMILHAVFYSWLSDHYLYSRNISSEFPENLCRTVFHASRITTVWITMVWITIFVILPHKRQI